MFEGVKITYLNAPLQNAISSGSVAIKRRAGIIRFDDIEGQTMTSIEISVLRFDLITD